MSTMAKTVITTDDLDGSSNAQEVTFSYQGRSYSIDLGKKNQAAFEKVLKPYVDAAQKTSSRSGSPAQKGGRRRATAASKLDLAAIRAWANANGHEVSSRGRVSNVVIEAYNNANA